MTALSTMIRSALEVDAALALTADYHIGSIEDRRYIDEQIRGIEMHLTESLIRGTVGTWLKVDGASGAIVEGDVVCHAPVAATLDTKIVTKAIPAALTAAGLAIGIALTKGAPNGWVRVAIFGVVPAAITGLAVALAGQVRVGTNGRAERVGSLGSSDYALGFVDALGNLTLRTGTTSGGQGTGAIPVPASPGDNYKALYAFNGDYSLTPTPLSANTFLGRSASGEPGGKAMIEAFFVFAALTLGAADTVPQVNAAGTAFEYGKIATANIDASAAIALSQLQTIPALSVVANATNATALPTAVAAGLDHQIFRRSGTALAFGSIDLSQTNAVGSSLLAHANIASLAGLSVFGRSANTTGVMAAITGTDGQVLRVSGTTLGFGTITTAGIADGSITLAKLANGTNTGAFLWWNGSAWTETTTVETDGTSLLLGSDPGADGAVRLSNNTFVTGKAVGGGTFNLVGISSADQIVIGENSAGLVTIIQNLPAGAESRISIGGTIQYQFFESFADFKDNPLRFTTSTGTGPSASAITVRHAQAAFGGRLLDDTAYANIFTWGAATDRIDFGATNVAGMVFSIATANIFRLLIAGTDEYQFTSTFADWKDNKLRFGTNPATSGLINSPHDSGTAFWSGRNDLNSADVGLLFWGATNRLTIGTSGVGDMRLNIGTGGTYLIDVNSANEYTINATALSMGTNVLQFNTAQTAGLINFTHNQLLASARNNLNNGNVALIHWGAAADRLDLGSTGVAGMDLGVATGGVYQFRVNAAVEYSLSSTTFDGNQNSLTDWLFVACGATPAASGEFRGLNGGGGFVVRNVANDGDIRCITVDSLDRVLIGGNTAPPVSVIYNCATGGFHESRIANVAEMVLTAATLDGQQNSLTDWAFAELGTGTMPTAGLIRVGHNQTVMTGRSNGGSNVTLITWGLVADSLILGSTSVVNSGYNVATGGTHSFLVNSAAIVNMDSSKMFIANTTAAPGTPSGGGHLYVEAGALKYKGPSGAVTELGAA